jgi:dTDP-4-amino-4,6-dideoxygalactose transaminase
MIPTFELNSQFQSLKSEMMKKLEAVLDRGQFILGQEVASFEQEFAQWNGSAHAIGVANGTDALQLALRAIEVGPGDEVICPTFTYVATASAISFTGAKPVPVDIDLTNFSAIPSAIEAAITPSTKAVILVHLYGHPGYVDEVLALCKKHNLHLVEDCAQATGASYKGTKVGNFGIAGCFSFFPTKNLGGYGDGGLVTSRDPKIAERIRMLRAQGQGHTKYQHDILGTNSRLDELQAAILRVKLPYLDRWNDQRRAIASSYQEISSLEHIRFPKELADCRHVYHQFTVLSSCRSELQSYLTSKGIGFTVYYPISVHLQPAYRSLGWEKGSFPNAELAQEQALSLPMFPEMTKSQLEEVCLALRAFQPVHHH